MASFEQRLDDLVSSLSQLETLGVRLSSVVSELSGLRGDVRNPNTDPTIGAGLAGVRDTIGRSTSAVTAPLSGIAGSLKQLHVRIDYPLYASGSDVSIPYSVTRYYAFEASGGRMLS